MFLSRPHGPVGPYRNPDDAVPQDGEIRSVSQEGACRQGQAACRQTIGAVGRANGMGRIPLIGSNTRTACTPAHASSEVTRAAGGWCTHTRTPRLTELGIASRRRVAPYPPRRPTASTSIELRAIVALAIAAWSSSRPMDVERRESGHPADGLRVPARAAGARARGQVLPLAR